MGFYLRKRGCLLIAANMIGSGEDEMRRERGSKFKRCGCAKSPRCEHPWTLVVALGRDPVTRKPKQVWRTFRGSGRDAERELTRLLSEYDTGRLTMTNLTLAGYLVQKWLPHIQTRVRPYTWTRYEELLRLHAVPIIGSVKLGEIRPLHVQTVVDKALAKGLAPKTVTQLYQVVSSSLRQAVRWQLIPLNPAQAVQPPRSGRATLTVPDSKTVAKIIEATKGTPLHIPVILAATTGMRRGEALGLRWRDVDLDAGVVHVVSTLQRIGPELGLREPKSARGRRTVALPAGAVTVLRRYRAEQVQRRLALGADWHDSDFVIERGDGHSYEPDTITHAFHKLLVQLKLPRIRYHDLRHAFATTLLKEGVHPKVVSEALGHASTGFTMDTYSHVLPSMQKQAAEAIERALPLT